MSGRKRGYIRPHFRGQVQAACANANRFLSHLSPPLAVNEIENQLKEARRQCREVRESAETQKASARVFELLNRMEVRREDLSLLLMEQRDTLNAVDAARRAFEQEMKSASLAAEGLLTFDATLQAALVGLDQGRSKVLSATSAAKPVSQKLETGLRELQQWRAEVQRALVSKSIPASNRQSVAQESLESIQARMVQESEMVALNDEFRKLNVEPDCGWNELSRWTQSGDAFAENQRLGRIAQSHLDGGDLKAARSAIDQLESYRSTAIAEMGKNRQAAERTQQIAEAIMEALYHRNYDTPVFGPLKEGDPLSGIQVRADVPNRDGRGNIRVDIHFDGRTEFEVENVDAGEEQACHETLGGLAEALAQDGLKLEIIDWGRASVPPSRTDGALEIPVRERMTEREQEREHK